MKKSVILGPARNRALFDNPITLKPHLAEQLKLGRLAIVLGAGASFGFGLPSWDVLIDRCLNISGMTRLPGRSAEDLGEDILTEACKGDDIIFARLVRQALYANVDLSIRALRSNELLAAIAALTMVSRRGSVGRVISFNFDDMLERYLRQSGFKMRSVNKLPCWSSNHDVTVYHPHGLLESEGPVDVVNEPIVFALIHYNRLRSDKPLWYSLLLDIFSSSTCLFIGLSGSDWNLAEALTAANAVHVGRHQHAFWGIRFSDDTNDPNLGKWETRGVIQTTLSNYDELPTFLFDVCQSAAQL